PRVDHEALRGRDHEAGVAPGVGPEHVARRRVDHERERDRRQDRGHQGRERGHLPDRPRDQRDQPGQQQRLVLVDDAVEVGKPHVAAREDVAREQRKTRLVVGGEDDGAEVEDRHQRGHGADDDRRRQQPTRHAVILCTAVSRANSLRSRAYSLRTRGNVPYERGCGLPGRSPSPSKSGIESEPIISAGCASTLATLSRLCEKDTMPTVHCSWSNRSISASAGAWPVCVAIWARFSPSSSRRRQAATKIWSNPTPPWESVPQRSPSTRHSSVMRLRAPRSPRRSRSLPTPPSWAQAGMRLSIFVLPALYG